MNLRVSFCHYIVILMGVTAYVVRHQDDRKGPGRPQGIVPPIGRVSPSGPCIVGTGLAPVLGGAGDPEVRMGDASVPTPTNVTICPKKPGQGDASVPTYSHQLKEGDDKVRLHLT
ncbi:MAG TPA: hypothetical protein VF026_30830 [Ktedonobacteraceae bacterium]